MKFYKFVYPFLCLLILSACTKLILPQNKNPNQEAGITVQKLNICDTYMESILYPNMNIKEIDQKIELTIKKYRQEFLKKVKVFKEERKAEFNVTYQSFIKDDRYISVKLVIYQNIYEQREDIETIVYDAKKDCFVHLYDIYREEGIQYLSDAVADYFRERFPLECDNDQFRSHISAVEQNFQLFVLKKDRIVFYFPQGTLFENAASFETGYQEFENLTLENEALPAYVPYDDILNEPTKNIHANQPMVALTFDDGPSKRYTAAILDALKEHKASATFFVLGANADNAPALLQRMVLEGNEIGNHTYTHKRLTTLSKERIEEEIVATQESIYSITHHYPEVIRPPYGRKNALVMECAKGKQLVAWTLDTRDWQDRNTKKIVERVLNTVKDGDIILMHDLYASSAQAAAILIPKLQEQGYQLVTVSELYEYRPNMKQ